MTNRPCLKPHLRVLRRSDGAVQLGLDGPDAVVLEGVSPAERSWLSLLDGTHDHAQLLEAAAHRGIPSGRAQRLLTLLAEHAALTVPHTRPTEPWSPAERLLLAPDLEAVTARGDDAGGALSARARATVLVDGAGAAAATVADVLLRAGVGRVERGAGLADAYLGTPAHHADLVVLTDGGPVAPERARPWHERGVAHLPVSMRAAQASVGPLVVPTLGPCLECIEHQRTDLDPSWPWLRAQVTPAGVAAPPRVHGETALRSVVAGLAGLASLAFLDGRDPRTGLVAVGAAIEVVLPGPVIERIEWPSHVRCRRCPPSARTTSSTPPVEAGTMTG